MSTKSIGIKNFYELVLVIKTEVSEEGKSKITEKVEENIKKFSGKVFVMQDWGKKRLAYEIMKETKGLYVYWRFEALPEVVHELERNLRLSESVLRFMTIKLSKKEFDELENPKKSVDDKYDGPRKNVSA